MLEENFMTQQNNWKDLIQSKLSRRSFLRSVGLAGAAGAAGTLVPTGVAAVATLAVAPRVAGQEMADMALPFTPIEASAQDEIVLPEGFNYQVLVRRGDVINADGRILGDHCDWTGWFPIDALEGGNSQTEGILTVNQEYFNPLFVSRFEGGEKTMEQVALEKAMVGVSHVHLRRDGDAWVVVSDSTLARRYDATDPIEFSGPVAGTEVVNGATEVFGTLANCSGGKTPWMTNLSCEENYQDYYGEDKLNLGFGEEGYLWYESGAATEGQLPEHYGWVVETDPYSGRAVKRTAMGRFRHENVATAIGKTGKVVMYMGDDKRDACVYKFVTSAAYDATNRDANLNILDEGTLYVANFGRGTWVPMVFEGNEEALSDTSKTGGYVIASQAEVLTYAHQVAMVLGGTRTDRPEDIEVHPGTGDVYIAMTNNSNHGNFHGQIVRVVEADNDPESLTFNWDIFAVGGPQSGFSSPDNLAFDTNGNLWMVTDISSSGMNRGIYTSFGNNSMFMFNTANAGQGVADAYRFASMPMDSEATGPTWIGEDTLILSIQHPGENSESFEEPTSRWPNFGTDEPRSSVVAITGPFGNTGAFGTYAFYDARNGA
jgi:uncharacterized protein